MGKGFSPLFCQRMHLPYSNQRQRPESIPDSDLTFQNICAIIVPESTHGRVLLPLQATVVSDDPLTGPRPGAVPP
jgi:hypothetical protein